MKVGLFLGSFNPIHIGHLIVANLIYEKTDRSEIWFVVSPQNPFKKNKQLLHEFDRFDMVSTAVSGHYHFKANDIEFQLPRPSYTINTLTHLKERHPNHDFKLIIGADNLRNFHKWKNHTEILNHHGLLVYPRGADIEKENYSHENITFVDAPLIYISASLIRGMIKGGQSPKYLVPDEVLRIITIKKHYL